MPEDFFRAGLTISPVVEWAAVVTFLAFAAMYFLAPVLGYPAEQRGLLLISLYLLVGYGALVLGQQILAYFLYLTGASTTASLNINAIFSILKLVVFLAAQGAFVFGLQGMRRTSSAHP